MIPVKKINTNGLGLSHAQANVLQRRKEKEERERKRGFMKNIFALSVTYEIIFPFVQERSIFVFAAVSAIERHGRETCSRCKSAHFFQPRRTESRLTPHSSCTLGQRKKKRVTRWTEEERGKKKKKQGRQRYGHRRDAPQSMWQTRNYQPTRLVCLKKAMQDFFDRSMNREKETRKKKKNLIHYSNWVSTATPGTTPSSISSSHPIAIGVCLFVLMII
jgi:hypothetical protein